MNDRLTLTVFFLLVLGGVFIQWGCLDLPNFAPIAALSMFAGFYFRSLIVASLVPFSVLTLSNIQLGGYGSWPIMIAVYFSLIFPAVLSQRFLRRDDGGVSCLRMTSFSCLGSILFFFVTNYAAWVQWYPFSFAGFAECYLAAIPFFRWTLMGDLFFNCTFFAVYVFSVSAYPRLAIHRYRGDDFRFGVRNTSLEI